LRIPASQGNKVPLFLTRRYWGPLELLGPTAVVEQRGLWAEGVVGDRGSALSLGRLLACSLFGLSPATARQGPLGPQHGESVALSVNRCEGKHSFELPRCVPAFGQEEAAQPTDQHIAGPKIKVKEHQWHQCCCNFRLNTCGRGRPGPPSAGALGIGGVLDIAAKRPATYIQQKLCTYNTEKNVGCKKQTNKNVPFPFGMAS